MSEQELEPWIPEITVLRLYQVCNPVYGGETAAQALLLLVSPQTFVRNRLLIQVSNLMINIKYSRVMQLLR